MRVEKVSIKKDHGSCNLCSRGELSFEKRVLVYPYEYVYRISRDSGSGLTVTICEDCLNEIKSINPEQI